MKKKLLFKLFLFVFSSGISAQQWDGYILYATMNGNSAVLMDTAGTTYHQWSGLTGKTGYSSYMLPNGVLLRTVARTGNSFSGGPICGEVQKVSWNGSVIWDYIYSTTNYCTHHDIWPMPNGNILLIAYELKTATEATQAGSTQNITMWPDKIVEIEPTGTNGANIVWEWHSWDHLVQDKDATKSNYQTSVLSHPELIDINYKTTKDWLHMNGVNYNPDLDQITFSSHNLNEVYVIDHSTTTAEAASHSGGNSGKGGDILYRWGNPAAYKAAGNQILNVVHDAHWIPKNCPKGGYLVGFNNNGISKSQSCVDLVKPPLNGYTYDHATDSAYTPLSYSWRHSCSGYTSNMGNSQQFPNGNMQICIALSGKIYEIDTNNNVLWTKTITGMVPKSFRYDRCFIDGYPAKPTITSSKDSLTGSSGNFYQWYMNGNIISGATSQTFRPNQDGYYQLQVFNANHCQSALSDSVNFIVSGINSTDKNILFHIYPNPTSGKINIENDNIYSSIYIVISDALGKIMFTEKNSKTIDISSFDNGLYFLSLYQNEKIIAYKKIILLKN